MSDRSWCFITVHPGVKVKIDKADLKKLEKHSWRVTQGTTGRKRVVTSIRTETGVKTITMGAFLMKPAKGKQVCPRRFSEELDYRRENLIVCTLSERQRFLPKKRTEASSVYRGVSFSKGDGKWRAGIEVEGDSINLGLFDKERDAAHAYNKAALKYFGKMAYQNIISAKIEKRR